MTRTHLATRLRWSAACLGLLAAGAGFAQDVDPFRTRNLSPLASIFGVPSWDAAVAEQSFSLTSEVANHYRLSERGGDALILDGETWRTNLAFVRSLNEDWFVSAELPYYRQSGGVLDNVVDAWHSIFSLPDGGRNNRGEDELLYLMGDRAGAFFNLDRAQSAWGDLQLSVGYRLGPQRGYVVEATVKLDTGDAAALTGSGSTDWAITLLRPVARQFRNRAAGYFWGLGMLRLGEPDLIRFRAEDTAYIAVLGGSLKLLPRWGMKAQLDVHTPFYDTPLEELGQTSVQLALGGWWDMSRRGVLEFAIDEDLHVSTAPDVVLHVGLQWRW